jgi:RNA polymerase sigma factor (sigma-70 family)
MLPTASPRVRLLSSDSTLVAMIRDGQDGAFEALYERHHRAILSFCRHLLGDPHEAEDAVQHTFLAAYRELAYTSKDITVRPWLFTIARNRCYSILRSRREQPTDDYDQLMTEGLSFQVQQREDLRELLRDMADLPEQQRAALVLSELDALSHHQIGDVLGVRPDKVKALVYQARSTLSAAKDARDTPCEDIRHELSVGRGAALRRGNLRRHLRDCDGCRAFRTQVERQRRGLRALLPVFPTIALRQSIFGGAAAGGTGPAATAGGAGTATVGGGALLGGAVKTSAAKAILAGLALSVGASGTAVILATGALPIDRLWDGAAKLPGHHTSADSARPRTGDRQIRAASAGPGPAGADPRILNAVGGSPRVLSLTSPFGQFVVASRDADPRRAPQPPARARVQRTLTSGLPPLVPGSSTGTAQTPAVSSPPATPSTPVSPPAAPGAPTSSVAPIATNAVAAPPSTPTAARTSSGRSLSFLSPLSVLSPPSSGVPTAGSGPAAPASSGGSSSITSSPAGSVPGLSLLGLGLGILSHLRVTVVVPGATGGTGPSTATIGQSPAVSSPGSAAPTTGSLGPSAASGSSLPGTTTPTAIPAPATAATPVPVLGVASTALDGSVGSPPDLGVLSGLYSLLGLGRGRS